MKVLFVTLRGPTNADRRGGAQDYIHRLSAPWASAGHEIRMLAGQERIDGELLADRETVDGISVFRCGTPERRLRPLIREARRLAPGADIVVENLFGVPLFLPWLLDRRTPLLAIKHHFEGTTFLRTQGVVRGLMGMGVETVIEPIVYRNTPWITNSAKTREGLQKRWLKPRHEPIVVAPGIDLGPVGALCPRSSVPTVLYFGALDLRRKRVDHLIEAFRKVRTDLPEARLILAGKGADEDRLRRQAAGLPVHFRGFVTDEEKIELLDEAWVFCSPSESEGFGITWVEANARGVPVVGYDLGLDTVTPACSIMVPRGSIDSLAASLATLLTDTARRERMGVAARNNAKRFSWQASSDRLFDFLEGTLAGSAGFAARPGTMSSR